AQKSERRGSRPWIWMLLGMFLTFAALVSFGVYLKSKEQPANSPVAEVTPTATPAATTPSSYEPPPAPSTMIPNAANLPANLANDYQSGSPANAAAGAWQGAGTSFDPSDAQWRVEIPELNFTASIYFYAGGAFQGTMSDGSQATAGRWTYFAGNSTLHMAFANGYEFTALLVTNGTAFRASYPDTSGVTCNLSIERVASAPTPAAPNKSKKKY
ncbi:MAG TPA: hypothetical protein VF551_01970, partial [Chthoniobacterales bacterium]